MIANTNYLSSSILAWSFGTTDNKSVMECMEDLNIKEVDLSYRILTMDEKDEEVHP